MKQKRKSTKTVSKYPFQFCERKKAKTKFESPYSEQLQTAVKATNHTVTTSDKRILHSKLISKPIKPFQQESSNRGTGQRGPDGRFARREDKAAVPSPEQKPGSFEQRQLGPLSVNTDQMSDSDRANI